MAPFALLHATAIALAVDADGPLAGVLLLGPSGAGKSSVALIAIETCPFHRTALVADDQVQIGPGGVASAPAALRGLIEVRGHGPARIRFVDKAVLIAAADLGAASERAPSPQAREVAPSVRLPLYPFLWKSAEATAAHRLRVIVRQVLCGQTGEDPQDVRP
jgi:HPr kinase/phosphorylase